jgi:hypothetical protein
MSEGIEEVTEGFVVGVLKGMVEGEILGVGKNESDIGDNDD